MTQDSSPALSVAMDYYHAWTSKDLDRAMTYIAPDIVCDAPSGRVEGVEAFYRPGRQDRPRPAGLRPDPIRGRRAPNSLSWSAAPS